ncbi:MAG TPA: hypothetical protein VJH90_04030 [archaeon]|nr:hypothetical protein [archaeon]
MVVLPINEVSLVLSLFLVVIWAIVKFAKRKSPPQSEDVVDLISLLFLGPVFIIGLIFIAISLNFLDFSIIDDIKTNVGISGAILFGVSLYFFYVTVNREEIERRHIEEMKKHRYQE